jgi:acetyl esterase/lipase
MMGGQIGDRRRNSGDDGGIDDAQVLQPAYGTGRVDYRRWIGRTARIRDAATAAGVDVAFETWRHGIHIWPVFMSAGLPESAAAIERIATFFKTQAESV